MYKSLQIILLAALLPACTYEEPGTGSDYGVQSKPVGLNIAESFLSYASGNLKWMQDSSFANLTGLPIYLELWDLDQDSVYFSAADSLPPDILSNALTGKAGRAKFSPDKTTRKTLGDYVMRKDGIWFFRVSAKDLDLKADMRIRRHFGSLVYDPSLEELAKFIENHSVYGGYFEAGPEDKPIVRHHGAMVSPPGEPSLTRLSRQITRGLQTDEEKAQRLLEFVNGHIKDDLKRADPMVEYFYRANEVLLEKRATPRGRVVLYASLLEQEGIDYRLLYHRDGVMVGVPGNFEGENGVTINGTDYFIVDFDPPHPLLGELGRKTPKISYYEDPGRNTPVIDMQTGNPLKKF